MKIFFLKLSLFGIIISASPLGLASDSEKYLLVSGRGSCADTVELNYNQKILKTSFLANVEIELNMPEKMKQSSFGRLMDMGPGGRRTKTVSKATSTTNNNLVGFKVQTKEEIKPGNDVFDYIINALDDEMYKTAYKSKTTEIILDTISETLNVKQLIVNTSNLVENSKDMFSYIELKDKGDLISGQEEFLTNSPVGEIETLNYDVYYKECLYLKH